MQTEVVVDRVVPSRGELRRVQQAIEIAHERAGGPAAGAAQSSAANRDLPRLPITVAPCAA